MTHPISKAEWRRWAKERRASVDFAVISPMVRTHLEESGLVAGLVLTYLAMGDEIDLGPLVEALPARWAITRTPAAGPLTVHAIDGPRERHRLGFDQPAPGSDPIDPMLLDVLLVPGLAFDRAGGRLGRGKGYIDGLLGRLRPDALTIGVVPEALVVDRLPMTATDRPVSHLATENGIVAFRVRGTGNVEHRIGGG